jgi:inhibitor of cysteine peptidase
VKTESIGRSLGVVAALLLAAGCGGGNPVSQEDGTAVLAKAADPPTIRADTASVTDTPLISGLPVRDLISPAVNPPGTIGVPPESQARQNRNVAVVTVTVTDQGMPVAGAAVGFSRAVSGKALDFKWTGVTDAQGQAAITLTQEARQFRRLGASGYYTVRAVDPVTGDVIGTWGSIAVSGGTDCGLALPVSGRAASSRATVFAVGPSPVLRLGQEDAGNQLEAEVGRTVAIALPANPSTGYTWTVAGGDPDVIAQAADAVFCQDSDLVGAPGYMTLQFYVVGPGATTLELAYRRPWETDVPPLETYSVEVSAVAGAAPDTSPPSPDIDWIDTTVVPPAPGDDGPTDVPLQRADIRGRIADLSGPSEGGTDEALLGRILVEAPASDTGIDKAWVTVTRSSVLIRRAEDGASEVPFSALTVGVEVLVQFDGPVMESYPVQATAGTVVIEG